MNEDAIATLKRLNSVMKQALESYGFTVVENRADADAVMDGNIGGWVTLHGPQPDPPKYNYEYWIESSKYGLKWQTELNVSSRASKSEVDRIGLQKVARNLFNAWKKSAKNAGIIVNDRLP